MTHLITCQTWHIYRGRKQWCTATHGNKLQHNHTAMHYNTLQRTPQLTVTNWTLLHRGQTPLILHCSTHCHTHCNTRCNTHCNTTQYGCTGVRSQWHNTLQHTATHCNTLQHTATHCNTLQHTTTHYNTLQYIATRCNTLQRTATHCNPLQHTATHCKTLHRGRKPMILTASMCHIRKSLRGHRYNFN